MVGLSGSAVFVARVVGAFVVAVRSCDTRPGGGGSPVEPVRARAAFGHAPARDFPDPGACRDARAMAPVAAERTRHGQPFILAWERAVPSLVRHLRGRLAAPVGYDDAMSGART